jgi:hypothetical protein
MIPLTPAETFTLACEIRANETAIDSAAVRSLLALSLYLLY